MKSLKYNTFFNFLLTISTLLFPLITMPYISRILNISDIGVINNGSALYTLFANLSSFGLISYGAREIARCRDNNKETNVVFFSVLFLHCIATFLFVIIFIIYTLTITDVLLKKILWLYILLLIISPFNIEWFYTGKEEFRYIAIRSILVKTISFLLVFLLVHKEDDIFKYATLTIISQGANTLFNIFNARKYVKFERFTLPLKKIFINSRFFYFQTLVALSYQSINQILLGSADKTELALFVRATTFTSIIASLINPIINAVKPRIENIVNNQAIDDKHYINIAFDCFFSLLCPLTFGMGILSNNIMNIFGGEQFSSGGIVLKIVLISSFFAQINTFINSIITGPNGFERNTFIANIFVAVISLILNCLLINRIGARGAAIALATGECVGTCIQLLLAKRHNLYIKCFNYKQLKYLFSSLFIFFLLFGVLKIISNIYLSTVISVVIGFCIYTFVTILICLIFKDEKPYLLVVLLNIIKKRIK